MKKESFKDRLAYLRKEKGLTQENLASELGMDKSTIAKYETGDRKPDMETLIQLALYFDTTIDFLVAIEDYENKSNKNSNN